MGALTPTGLQIHKIGDLTYDQCESLCAMFGSLHKASAWAIGDLLLHIEKVYGETYAQAAEVTGLQSGTLMNYTSVCAHIPRSRRRADVPFSTHAEVAYLPPEEQEKWLKEASANKWTKAELRHARKGELPPAVETESVCPTCGRAWSPQDET